MRVSDIALSGMQAASTRLANSANNIANAQSTARIVDGKRESSPFVPQDVVSIAVEPTGGVETELRTRTPASVPVNDPDNPSADAEGITQYPNVNIDEAVAGLPMNTYTFQANLKALQTDDENMKSLLDITA